jgi:hypothetical protein
MSVPEILDVQLTPAEVGIITRPIVGKGGHQRLLVSMLAYLNRETNVLRVLPTHLELARRYVTKYGDGGYQERFRAVLDAVERTVRAQAGKRSTDEGDGAGA